MNKERYEQIRDCAVQARDFTIQIKDLELNWHNQDVKFLKMKVWLNF